MENSEFVEVYEAPVVEEKGRAGKVHMIANAILCILAILAFLWVAVFTYSAIDAYIDMQNYNGEGFDGGAVGFAFCFVFLLIGAVVTIPLSVACAISSGISLKIRKGLAATVSRITLWLSISISVITAITVVVLYLLGAN